MSTISVVEWCENHLRRFRFPFDEECGYLFCVFIVNQDFQLGLSNEIKGWKIQERRHTQREREKEKERGRDISKNRYKVHRCTVYLVHITHISEKKSISN